MVLSIQYLRGIAALLVVLSHVAWKGKQYSTDPLSAFRIGEAGVDIFFVISGFIMCHTTAKSLNTIGDSVNFMAHRVTRIIPLYWALTLLVLPVYLLFPARINSGGGVTEIFNSFFLVPTDNKYLIQAGWTLSYEFFFYGIFAVGMLMGKRVGHAATALVLVGLFCFGTAFNPETTLGKFATDSLLVEFAFGILLYHMRIRGLMTPMLGTVSIIVAVILLLSVNFDLTHARYRCFRLGVPAFLLCYGLVSLEAKLLKAPFSALKSLGDSSYSLYLTHPFSLALLGPMIFYVMGRNNGAIFALVLTLSAVVLGWYCYKHFENRITRLVKASKIFGVMVANRTVT
jgi:exopolysaccharide production protein ExoZ